MGEAVCQQPSKKPQYVTKKAEKRLKKNEVEQLARYLEKNSMSVDMKALISCYQNGLTVKIAKAVFKKNMNRYEQLSAKLQDQSRAGFMLFNAFLIDYKRYRQRQLDLIYVKESSDGI